MKIQYLGTAAAEGIPAIFCECENCRKSRMAGGRNIRTRSQALIDDRLLIDFPADTYMHFLQYNVPLAKIKKLSYHSFTFRSSVSCRPGNEKKRFFSHQRRISADIFLG